MIGRLDRRDVAEWRYADDVSRFPLALGCTNCPELEPCGGLHVGTGAFNCLDYCCNKPESCDMVCKRNPLFVDRVHEVGGFSLSRIAQARSQPFPSLPHSVPVIYGPSGRKLPFGPGMVAVSLYQLVKRRTGEPRFSTYVQLCERFRIDTSCSIIACGVAVDPPLERWWDAGDQRRSTLQALKELGIAAITTPNFSLFNDVVRLDNLHSMKRIALSWEEMTESGIPTSLHVNARTDRDWERWTKFVLDHPEISSVTYEFATGAAGSVRMKYHVRMLKALAEGVNQPLMLLVRGGLSALASFRESFDKVVFLDSTSHIKTVHRLSGTFKNNRLRWGDAPGRPHVCIDQLMRHNASAVLAAATPAVQ